MTTTPATPPVPDTAANTNIDTGVLALVLAARMMGIAVDPQQLLHQLAGTKMAVPQLLRAAKRLELKASSVQSDWPRLAKTFPPCIVVFHDGSFAPISKITEDSVFLQDPAINQPRAMPRAEFEQNWTGEVILLARRKNLSNLAKTFNLSWFMRAMYKYRHRFYEVLLASFFLQLFALVSPLFFQVVIDKVLVHHSKATLYVLVLGLAIVGIFESILAGLRSYVLSHTTSRIDIELATNLFQHLFALPISWFEERRAGDSVARMREVENIRSFLTGTSLTLAIDVPFTLVFLIVMAYYSLFLTGIVIASFPFLIAIYAVATPRFRALLKEKFNRGSENQAFLIESITGVETLKAMAVEPQMQVRWEEQQAAYVKSSQQVVNLGNWASQGVQLVSKLNTAAILLFGAMEVIDGSLTVGGLVAFNMLAQRVMQPVIRLAQCYQDFQQARVSVERLGDILNSTPEPFYTPGRTALPAIKGAITFEHVNFRFSLDTPERLSDITLSIPAGQVVGIVGSSGSGKSTLTKLVQRLRKPTAGNVLVDGVNLSTVDVNSLRSKVGVVLQDNTLFNRTIRENIAFSQPGMPFDDVMRAAKLAGAHDFILELPQGYDTMVGERGSSLSGGQRQRIAIARALITNPRILIFDEATSALDLESESIIQQNMSEIVKGRTVIIIAHRLSAVRRCHRILTIEKGRIVEDGTHDVLSRSGGRYAELLRIQSGEAA